MSKPGLFEEVRAGCARVAERAQSVRIRDDQVQRCATELAAETAFRPTLDPRYHYVGAGEDTIAFVLCLDAVNFGSGWFRWWIDHRGLACYFSLAGALRERFAGEGPFRAAELAAIDAASCRRIFGQQEAPPAIDELMMHFARAWRELGQYLIERFGGRFDALVEAADGSAERLVEILIGMPMFDDVATYAGRRVPFWKRAQLCAVDLSLAFSGAGVGRFHDLDRLTVFADNQVPQVLRAEGVLEYESDLAARIERGDELVPGSPEEVEIRACTVEAVERLVVGLGARGRPRAAWELDQLLWQRGLGLARDAGEAHRTRTIFY